MGKYAKSGVGAGGRNLDPRKRQQEAGKMADRGTRNGEVRDRAGSLCAVEGVEGNFNLAQGVLLGSVGGAAATTVQFGQARGCNSMASHTESVLA